MSRWNRRKRIRFAPLGGNTAGRYHLPVVSDDPETVIFVRGGAVYRESGAVIRAVAALGGAWRAVLIFLLVPAVLRDGLYRGLARRRYRWFGTTGQCRIPSPEERPYFLD